MTPGVGIRLNPGGTLFAVPDTAPIPITIRRAARNEIVFRACCAWGLNACMFVSSFKARRKPGAMNALMSEARAWRRCARALSQCCDPQIFRSILFVTLMPINYALAGATAIAFGLAIGERNTLTLRALLELSRCLAKDPISVMDQIAMPSPRLPATAAGSSRRSDSQSH